MARVHVITMMRNEGETLRRWCDHYAHLFGWKNLTILDNRSTDSETLRLLAIAKLRGARVLEDFPNYRVKNTHMLRLFKELDDLGKHDFFLPCDCDELLATFTDTGITTSKAVIHAEFVRFMKTDKSLRIPSSLYNDPAKEGRWVPEMRFTKSFFRAGAVGTLDHGFHAASSGLAPGTQDTRFTYLHLHNRPLPLAKELAQAKLKNALACLKAGDESARMGVKYNEWIISATQAQWTNRFAGRLRFDLDGERVRLIFPDDSEITWNGTGYLVMHPDIAGHSHGALHHYLRHGCNEGRPVHRLIRVVTQAIKFGS